MRPDSDAGLARPQPPHGEDQHLPIMRERRAAAGRIWIGTSGWSYPGWDRRFYPAGLRRQSALAYNARQFNAVEVNGSFYGLLRPQTYAAWSEQTPPIFLFAVKGSRFITHNKKLRDVEVPLANFLASGVLRLGRKLGPIVWQLAESTRFDAARMAAFFELLPRDTFAAARLAQRHDHRLDGRSWTQAERRRPVRHAIEVRGTTFLVPEFVRLARRYGVAIVISDAPDWPLVEELTTGFVYLRLHGAEKKYASRYDDRALDRWASRIRAWSTGRDASDAQRITSWPIPRRVRRDVYVFFDNDYEANAPHDALRLAARLGIGSAATS